jgi:hypothetical protein
MPPLFEFAKGTVFNQGAQIVGIQDRQRLVHWQTGQKDGFIARTITLTLPLVDHKDIERVGLKILPQPLFLMGGIAILIIGRDRFDPVEFYLTDLS